MAATSIRGGLDVEQVTSVPSTVHRAEARAHVVDEGSQREVVDSIVRSLRARLGEAFDVEVILAEVRLGEAFDVEVILAEVCAELAAYSTARVQQFVPILVESHVRTRLQRG
jgi:hypothetical protein